jgi:hypothetical protein
MCFVMRPVLGLLLTHRYISHSAPKSAVTSIILHRSLKEFLLKDFAHFLPISIYRRTSGNVPRLK